MCFCLVLQLLAQAADALSLGDDVTRQVHGLNISSSTTIAVALLHPVPYASDRA
jgi:hypothetical protein